MLCCISIFSCWIKQIKDLAAYIHAAEQKAGQDLRLLMQAIGKASGDNSSFPIHMFLIRRLSASLPLQFVPLCSQQCVACVSVPAEQEECGAT
jgi:hypothetical protein